MTSCQATESLGPYLLGALDSRERAAVEAHLADCAACRTIAEELRPVPVLLGRLHIDDLTPAEPSHRLLERLLAAQATARRRRGVGVLVAAGALAALVGVAGGVIGAGAPADEPSAETVAVTAAEGSAGISATAWLTPSAAGTGIRLHLDGVPGGERCSLVVRDRDGRTETAATWRVRYGEDVDVPTVTTEVALDRIDELVVTTTDGEELVSFPPIEM
jgi:Putative zinc-finger